MVISQSKIYLVVLMFLTLILFSNASDVSASEYLGEYCWNIHATEDAHPPATENTVLIKLGVSYTGGSHYLIQGAIPYSNGNPGALSGSASVVGNKVYANFSFSEDDVNEQERITGNFQLNLDTSNLSGVFWAITRKFDTISREFSDGYGAGTATLTTCP